MNKTSIAWVANPDPFAGTGFTWNPFAGCRVGPCRARCYAERLAGTRLVHLPAYAGLTRSNGWTGEMRFFPEKLAEPLRRRTPSGIFVGDMGDIAYLRDEQIAAIFGIAAACPQHRFYFLTKQPGGMRGWFEWASVADHNGDVRERIAVAAWGAIGESVRFGRDGDAIGQRLVDSGKSWPLPNVWLGTSVCCRADMDIVAELRATPAAVHYLSLEPLLEYPGELDLSGIDWVIVGGESGPQARPCHVEWIRGVLRQCREAGVPAFCKQLGATAVEQVYGPMGDSAGVVRMSLRDRAGADPAEWPADLRVRQMPAATGPRPGAAPAPSPNPSTRGGCPAE